MKPATLKHGDLKENSSSWLLPWEGKRKLKHPSNILTCGMAERLPKGLASVWPESKHWQERVPGWGLLRIKVMVWTSIHSVAIVPPFPPTTQHRIRKPLFLPGEGKSWHLSPTFHLFRGLPRDSFCRSSLRALMVSCILEVPRGHWEQQSGVVWCHSRFSHLENLKTLSRNNLKM